MSKNKEENITFEQAIEELETIINRLEEGDEPLDETINLYEKVKMLNLMNIYLRMKRKKS